VKEFFAAHPDSALKTIRLVMMEGPLMDLVRKELG
jgi:hypothetical protein